MDTAEQAAAAARLRDRLDASEAARKARDEARREATDAAADPRQSVAAFASRHEALRVRCEAALNAMTAAGGDEVAVHSAATEATAVLQHMEADAAASALFLPSYDLRAAQQAVSGLRARVAAAESAAAPKAVFSFRRATPAAPAAALVAAAAAPRCAPAFAAPPEGAGLRNLFGGTRTLRADALGGPDADFAVEDCQGAAAEQRFVPIPIHIPIPIPNPFFSPSQHARRLHAAAAVPPARAAPAPPAQRHAGGLRVRRRVRGALLLLFPPHCGRPGAHPRQRRCFLRAARAVAAHRGAHAGGNLFAAAPPSSPRPGGGEFALRYPAGRMFVGRAAPPRVGRHVGPRG